MIKNAFAYVTRKSLKSLIIMLVILSMSILSFISLSIKDATDRASKETLANITNSFSMEINRQVNPGTPRGGGNVKGEDIKKISQTDSVESYVKRINSVADLVDYDIIETQETLANQSPERAKNFKRTVMLTGVNDSSKETKFVSEAYKLVEGKHLENEDKNKILMHKDLAEGFNKTLSSLDINVLPKFIIYVVIFMSLVLLVSLIISSFNILRRNPKELLIDNN